jgi:hypothetical protein
LERAVIHKAHVFCIFWVLLLTTSFAPSAFAYWPIVFQIAKEGSDFAAIRGPLQVKDSGLTVDPDKSAAETVASYMFVLNEFVSFREEILKAMEVYLQIYPTDVRGYEFGKIGEVYFNGAVVKRFNLTLSFHGEKLFFDKSNYRFTKSSLGFPIPLYSYLSNQSLFIPVPASLLETNINVTFRMDPNVLWEVYVISVIVRIIPNQVSAWWQENLPLIYGIASAQLVGITMFIAKFLKRRILKNWVGE